MAITTAAERAALNKLIDYLDNDPESHLDKIMSLADKLVPADVFPTQRSVIEGAMASKSNWYQLVMKLFQLNPQMRTKLLKALIVDANVLA